MNLRNAALGLAALSLCLLGFRARLGSFPARPAAPVSPERRAGLLYGAWSRDGVQWNAPTMLAQACENPKLAWIDLRPHVMVDAPAHGGMYRAEIGLNGAGGYHLGPLVAVSIDGERDPHGEPCLLRLPSGRYRLYYTAWSASGSEIRSAASDDAIRWTRDPGARLSDGAEHPDIVQARSGLYRLFHTRHRSRIESAISRDGLLFESETSPRLVGEASSTTITPLLTDAARGEYRMLYENDGRTCCAVSSEGEAFALESRFTDSINKALRHPRSPSLAILLDGTWLVLFTGEPG